VYRAAAETLGKLEPAALAPLLISSGVTSMDASEADQVVAQLRGSRWRRSGLEREAGKTHTVNADLSWGDDGSSQKSLISHTSNFITTNGWWVTRATIIDQRVEVVDWSSGAGGTLEWQRL
jgi:hypothetical protein